MIRIRAPDETLLLLFDEIMSYENEGLLAPFRKKKKRGLHEARALPVRPPGGRIAMGNGYAWTSEVDGHAVEISQHRRGF